MTWLLSLVGVTALFFALPQVLVAQPITQVPAPQINISFPGMDGPEQVVPALKILMLLTVLSLAPGILVTMTSFTRIVVVMSFARQALGTQNVPPLQVVMSLSLLLTAVVMAPVASQLNAQAFDPYVEKEIGEKEALGRAEGIVRDWMLTQTREQDLVLFYELSKSEKPTKKEEVSLHLLIPAFMISELRTGFEMGFLLFLPFVLVDLIVATMLTAMGMVMLPPTMISIPMKLLLFVSVDGWGLLTRSIVGSFS